MPIITFIAADGRSFIVEAQNGASLMDAATRRNIPGILAECGGSCACATCHVLVDDGWIGRLKPASDMEQAMLDFSSVEVAPGSRLSCQIFASDALDGLVLHIPETQG
jgi:2Fe-2S ferredoxin